MNTENSKSSKSIIKSPGLWLGVAGATVAAGITYYLRHKKDIDFYVRLYSAKTVADKFYAEHPHITKNIEYGPRSTQRLDIYSPGDANELPVVIFVHGGSWYSGNKKLYAPVAQRLIPEGFVTVIPGYTLYPEGTYRQQTTDAALAIAWTLDHIAEYGGNPKKVFVIGQSSGAHIASLAMFDPQWLTPTGHTVNEIAGFIGISGVYDIEVEADFYSHRPNYNPDFMVKLFEGEQNYEKGSPINYIRPGLPPSLLIHGDADYTVPIEISEAFYNALVANGNKSTYIVYPKGGHTEMMFEALATNPARLVRDMVAFVQSHR
jgi:acetyl esterase/lipase